jgi:hypothetical protein
MISHTYACRVVARGALDFTTSEGSTKQIKPW